MENNTLVRTCGECSLCCKLFRVDELSKPSWSWCRHCKKDGGCAIYSKGRPDVCKDFRCHWLRDLNIPDHLRPDKIHMYAQSGGDKIVKIMVDDAHPEALESEGARELIEGYRQMGNHVLLVTKDCIKYLCGHGREKLALIKMDWIL